MSATLPLAAATYGFLYHLSLEDSLREIAEAGFELVELSASPPHIDLSDFTSEKRRRLNQELERLQLRCVATNAIELNPTSSNEQLSHAAFHQYRTAIELAADVGADSVVMITGRMNLLVPMPEARAENLLRAQLERLLPVAQTLGVTLTLEPVPFGFLQTATEVASFIQETGFDELGMTFDCANLIFAGDEPVEAFRATAPRVKVVHVSDSWRDRFAHTQVGRADVDFGAFAEVLREVSYAGPSVYELADGADPAPRLRGDRDRLAEWGWR